MTAETRPRTRARAAALGAAGALAATCLTAVPASAAPPTAPFLAEVHYDDAGADSGEAVEVQLPAGTSSAGLSVVLYNGSGGAPYDTDALPAVTAPDDADAVAVVEYPANGLQNGSPDGIALVDDGVVLEFLSYEGVVTATSGPAAGLTSTDIGVAEVGTEPEGQSLSRRYDAGADALVWSGPATATFGTLDTGGVVVPPPAAEVCDVPAADVTAIGAVQGSGAATPLDGQEVTVRGTVVADLPGLGGFHLQDADGDPATSDALFVAADAAALAAVDLGDEVAVTGTAGESFAQTQVAAGAVEVCADGTPADLPAAAPLALPSDDAARERLEGMLVTPAPALTVSEVFDLTSFGELALSSGGVLVQPTEVARPGAAAAAVAASNALRSIVLDDASGARTSPTARPYLSPTTPVRVGDVLDLTAPVVLGYGFGAWRLQPADGTAEGTFAGQDTRPAAPDAVGGDVQVGAFNVLNYFLTLGGEGRGATSAAELEEQAGKIVPAIRALDADVVTLMEIEDTASTGYGDGSPDQAVAELVGRLNAAEGRTVWAYSPFPDELLAVDRDVIRNAIIYRSDVVTPVGDSVGLVDESVWSNAREPIAQAFTKDGDAFTVVANHFKSKGGTGATGDDTDTGQGAFNGARTRQAASLVGFVDSLVTSTGDPDVIALGDFNAYSQEDPIELLRTDGGLTDLGAQLDPGRYSYVFDALSGSLDHALATESLTAKVTDAVHWNINSVESSAYQYTGDPALYAADPYRSSDHDPLVVGIDLAEVDPDAPTGTVSGGTEPAPNRKSVVVSGTFVNTSPVAVLATLTTPYGESKTRKVQPGRSLELQQDTGRRTVPAGEATIRVTARVDGRDVASSFAFEYEGLTAPRG